MLLFLTPIANPAACMTSFPFPVGICCQCIRCALKSNFDSSEENGRRVWRKGDQKYYFVNSCSCSCIQVSVGAERWGIPYSTAHSTVFFFIIKKRKQVDVLLDQNLGFSTCFSVVGSSSAFYSQMACEFLGQVNNSIFSWKRKYKLLLTRCSPWMDCSYRGM